VDADARIADRDKLVALMQNVSDSLMLDYNDMSLISYDSTGYLQFANTDPRYTTKNDYIQALETEYQLLNPFSAVSSGFSILISLLSAMERHDDENYVTIFITEGYSETDNPSLYYNFYASHGVPMIVIAISPTGMTDIRSQFNLYTYRYNSFIGFDSLDAVSSEAVLERIYSDEMDFGSNQPIKHKV
jgi:hypothetical protein